MDKYVQDLYQTLDGSSALADPIPVEEKDDSLSNAFSSGLATGVEGLGSSIDYFQSLAGTLVGADEYAEQQLKEAEFGQELARAASADVTSFEDFLDEPSITGAFTQVAKFGGQGIPSLIYSIGSAATGGLGGLAVGAALKTGSKKAAERIVKDSLDKVAKGTATKADLDDAQTIFNYAKYVKAGALGGAASAEFPALSGENFGEAIEAGQERTKGLALQSAGVAIPQTVIGVGTEAAFLKMLAKKAKARSKGENSIFGRLAKAIAVTAPRGAGLEGLSELGQSELGIAQRRTYDPDYSQEEANLRRMESFFAGAVIGGFAGGAGSIGSVAYQNRDSISKKAGEIGSATQEKTQAVFDKARKMWNDSVSKREFDKQDAEEAPVRRSMDIDEVDPNEQSVATQEQEATQAGIVQETDLSEETQVVVEGAEKTEPSRIFDNTETARQAYIKEFGDTDFNDPFYAGMTETFLQKVAKQKSDFPDQELIIEKQGDRYVAIKQDASFLNKADVISQLNRAARSSKARGSGVFLKTPDGKTRPINLVDLATAGRRLLIRRGENVDAQNNQTDVAALGLTTFLADMQLADTGYDILVENKSIFDIDNNASLDSQIDTSTTAAIVDGASVPLGTLLKRTGPSGPSRPFVLPETRETNIETNVPRGEELATPFLRGGTRRNITPQSVDESTQIREADIRDEEGELVAKTRLNLETTPGRDINRTRGASPREIYVTTNNQGKPTLGTRQRSPRSSERRTFRKAEYPLGEINRLSTQFINKAIAQIKPKLPVAVLGIREVLALSDSELAGRFNDSQVSDLVKKAATELRNTENKLGEYIGFTNGHVVLVDNISVGNDLQLALTAAHEALGHVLFQEELDSSLTNKTVRERLEKAFDKAKNAKDAPSQYQGEYGFEEWYADQTASWAQKLYINEKKTAANGVVNRHFAAIVEKLRSLWNALSSEFKKRFGRNAYSQTFDEYMENTIVRERARLRSESGSVLKEVTYRKKAIVRAMEETISNSESSQKTVGSILKNFRQHVNNDTQTGHTLLKAILPEDNMLRSISPVIADMMYVRSNSQSNANNQFGFLKGKGHVRGQMFFALERILGDNWDSTEVQEALAEAANQDIKTANLQNPKAKEVRDYLSKLYDDYISKVPGNEIQKRDDYYPVSLDLAKIYTDPDAFAEIILQNKPEYTKEQVYQIIDKLVAKNESILDENEINIDPTDPQSAVEQARILTSGIEEKLIDFRASPEVALINYLRHIMIHSEWNRNTRDADGNDLLGPELEKLTDTEKEQVIGTLNRYLGYTTKPMNPKLSKAQSWLQFFNWVTLLAFATIGSIPELGGAVFNTKELKGFGMAKNALLSRITNPEQAVTLARTIGVTHSTAMGNLGLTEADAEFLDPAVRKYSDKFFEVILLDKFTRYTREFASVLGVEFLIHNAENKTNNPRADRYLRDHGVTAEQVKSWAARQSNGNYSFSGEDGAAVQAALQRFVDNSMLRPNAAERTSWGNDPRYQLIWSLKSYMFSFSKVILGGFYREVGARVGEAKNPIDGLSSVAMMGLITAMSFMPLAMLSLELREIAKATTAAVLPGVDSNARYFRSNRMDTAEYMAEIFDRSGLAGPFMLFGMVGKSVEWGERQGLGPIGQTFKGLSPILGPTYGLLVDDIALGLYSGKGWDVVPSRIIPGYNLVL